MSAETGITTTVARTGAAVRVWRLACRGSFSLLFSRFLSQCCVCFCICASFSLPRRLAVVFKLFSTQAYSGDNGQAVSAALNYPSTVLVDRGDYLWIADTQNHAIRQ